MFDILQSFWDLMRYTVQDSLKRDIRSLLIYRELSRRITPKEI